MEVNKSEISLLEKQLAVKKSEYLQALQRGQIHRELKKIFLDIKDLEQKLNVLRIIISEVK